MRSTRRSTGSKLSRAPAGGRPAVWLLALCAVASPAVAADERKYLAYRSGQTTFYADRVYTLEWTPGPNHWPAPDRYVLRISHGGAVVVEQHVPAPAPLRVTLRYPPLRPGVQVETLLSIAAMAGGRMLSGVHMQPMVWHSPKALAGPVGRLQADDVGVVDLTEDGRLTAFLEAVGVPHTALAEADGFSGAWLIASGAGIEAQDAWFDELVSRWQQGVSILLLPPLSGTFRLPPHLQGDRVITADETLVREADETWNLQTAEDRVREHEVAFRAAAVGAQPAYEAAAAGTGPSWIELSRGGARLILCGWDLPARHLENPSAGLFLRRVLAERAKKDQRTGLEARPIDEKRRTTRRDAG